MDDGRRDGISVGFVLFLLLIILIILWVVPFFNDTTFERLNLLGDPNFGGKDHLLFSLSLSLSLDR